MRVYDLRVRDNQHSYLFSNNRGSEFFVSPNIYSLIVNLHRGTYTLFPCIYELITM